MRRHLGGRVPGPVCHTKFGRDALFEADPSAELRGVCLARTVELDNVRLPMRDWPGLRGPLIHVPDPLSPSDGVVLALAAGLTPRYRVVSVASRGDSAYQVDAFDLLGVLRQFGFASPVLIGERLGCVVSMVVGAWYPDRVAGLILVDAEYDPPPSDTIQARALRDCPPEWRQLRRAITCPVVELSTPAASLAADVESFLQATLP